jgi:ubiquinone/menaquinone biosynthesis C-methylase UbiE
MVSRSVRAGTSNLTNRERWLEQILQRIPAGSRILDAGAGELQYKRFCPHLDYVSQDFAQYNGKGDGKGLQTGAWDQSGLDIVSDITSIPEADASFDAVVCIEVLEHVPYPIDALRELSRLTKPGGTLIVTAPFCSLTHFAPYFYQTGYSRYFYEYWLRELGFDIEEMNWNGNYFEYLAQELQRLPSIAKEYSHKRLNPTTRMLISCLLNVLGRLSRQDEGSEQLLCYGLHVRARKHGG